MVDEELIAAANNAAIMVRAPNFNPMAIGTMYAAAQRAMGAHHDENFRDTPQSLHDEDAALPLIAAARTLHTIAISQSVSNTDRSITVRTTLLAATAYAMHGNLPSAAAVLRDIGDSELQSEAQALTVAICVPSSIGRLMAGTLPFSPNGRGFLELLNRYLLSGEKDTVPAINAKIDELSLSSGDVFDMVLMANCRVALAHVIHLSVSRRVSSASHLMKEFAQRLVSKGRPCLLPSQYALLVSQKFAKATENSIVTLPTSGGKTLLAEFAIVRALATRPGVALYIVPYNALGNQVYDTLVQHLPGDIKVHRLFGGFKGATLAVGTTRDVVIATPERADALLRSGDYYPHLRIAVFDEAHVIENGARGARVEAIIARLRMKQTAGASYRIVLLSAVLSEVSALCSWLGPDAKHYTNPWRPTARRIAVWEGRGSLNWIYGNDPLRPAARAGGDSLVRNPLPWPIPLYPAEEFARIKAQLPAAFANVSYLARFMTSLLGGPLLILCGTKANTRGVAQAVASALPPIANIPNSIQKIIDLVSSKHPYLRQLAANCERGVAYHNSALPTDIKAAIENAIKSRDIVYVAATTTLAEGVDLPFRVTIVFDWLMGFGASQKPMAPLLFRNIAGRCGRAGEFVEGDTVIFDNVLGNMRFTRDTMRPAAQESILSDPLPLVSSIANDNYSGDERREIKSVISSQLLASIPEHPTVLNVDQALADHLYSRYSGTAANDVLLEARNELLDSSYGEPFAKAASPMYLTGLGKSANQTGLSAGSCRVILSYLSEMTDSKSIEELSADIIELCGDLPEQGNKILEKLATGSLKRAYMDASDIRTMCAAWMNKTPIEKVFLDLPKAKNSKSAIKPSAWADGQSSEFVDAQFDKFTEIMEYTFGFFLPWMLRAFGHLAASSSSYAALLTDWPGMAQAMEDARAAQGDVLDQLDAEN